MQTPPSDLISVHAMARHKDRGTQAGGCSAMHRASAPSALPGAAVACAARMCAVRSVSEQADMRLHVRVRVHVHVRKLVAHAALQVPA